jgi:hypothetical protein
MLLLLLLLLLLGPASHLWQLLGQLHQPAGELHTKLIKHYLWGPTRQTHEHQQQQDDV